MQANKGFLFRLSGAARSRWILVPDKGSYCGRNRSLFTIEQYARDLHSVKLCLLIHEVVLAYLSRTRRWIRGCLPRYSNMVLFSISKIYWFLSLLRMFIDHNLWSDQFYDRFSLLYRSDDQGQIIKGTLKHTSYEHCIRKIGGGLLPGSIDVWCNPQSEHVIREADKIQSCNALHLRPIRSRRKGPCGNRAAWLSLQGLNMQLDHGDPDMKSSSSQGPMGSVTICVWRGHAPHHLVLIDGGRMTAVMAKVRQSPLLRFSWRWFNRECQASISQNFSSCGFDSSQEVRAEDWRVSIWSFGGP